MVVQTLRKIPVSAVAQPLFVEWVNGRKVERLLALNRRIPRAKHPQERTGPLAQPLRSMAQTRQNPCYERLPLPHLSANSLFIMFSASSFSCTAIIIMTYFSGLSR
jgi:hypothetical protein